MFRPSLLSIGHVAPPDSRTDATSAEGGITYRKTGPPEKTSSIFLPFFLQYLHVYVPLPPPHGTRVSIRVCKAAPTLVWIISKTSTALPSLISTSANRAISAGGGGRWTLFKLHVSKRWKEEGGAEMRQGKLWGTLSWKVPAVLRENLTFLRVRR